MAQRSSLRFVDDGRVEGAMNEVRRIEDEQIAEVIESGLFGGDIRDIGTIAGAPLGRRHVVIDVCNRQPERAIDGTHPRGIAPGQVVVEGKYMHAAAGQGHERGRHDGG